MKYPLIICLLFGLASMSGCGINKVHPQQHARQRQNVTPKFSTSATQEDITSLLDAGIRFAALQPEKQIVEIRDAQEAYDRTKSPQARLKLAMLLALHGGAKNTKSALDLLEGYAWRNAPSGYPQFASILVSLLTHQHGLSGKLAETAHKLSVEREARHRLQKQLNALKAIEKTMNQRDKPIEPPL